MRVLFNKNIFCFLYILLVIVACSPSEEQPKTKVKKKNSNDPALTITNNVELFRKGDLNALLKSNLTEQEFLELKQGWESFQNEPTSDTEAAEFSQQMAMLNQEGAEQILFEQLKPQLEQFKTQSPLFIAMGQAFLQAALQESTELSDEQRAQAQKAVTSLTTWAQTTDLTSEELAKQGIGIFVSTAREMNINTIDELKQLNFEEALGKGSKIVNGAKKLLNLYGINVDQILNSVKAKTMLENSNEATVNVAFNLFENIYEFETQMEKKQDRWLIKSDDSSSSLDITNDDQ